MELDFLFNRFDQRERRVIVTPDESLMGETNDEILRGLDNYRQQKSLHDRIGLVEGTNSIMKASCHQW